jgi:hypothetical protein
LYVKAIVRIADRQRDALVGRRVAFSEIDVVARPEVVPGC